MLFNSFQFIVFFPIIFILYYLIPQRQKKVRNFFLLVVSYLLYINWSPAYSLILFGVTFLTYSFARWIDNKNAFGKKKYLIYSGIFLAILPLLVFKYYNFITATVDEGLDIVGLHIPMNGLNWAIPLGISFFTFQAIGYLWDVYYRRIEVETNFVDYALFISFFPQIASGPINKASLMLPQIKADRQFHYNQSVEGLKFLLWGMFMKVVVADRLSLYVDTILNNYSYQSGISCFVASVMYTIQIYSDFGGYSLMAIGTGKLLGFDLTTNFIRPYFSLSITDFWRRWHISLSTWLKDYIYIPLGGSRCSKVRNYWNIIITFLVSGIWHGANWTYIIWGILHGIFQVVEKFFGIQQEKYSGWKKFIHVFVTFLIVNFLWIFFRMNSLAAAVNVVTKIFTDFGNLKLFLPDSSSDKLFILIGLSMLILKEVFDEFFPSKLRLFDSKYLFIRLSSYIFVLLIILLIGVFDSGQFIYVSF
jgi:alginate O-acetyltransferase complex protein AlgI